MSGTSEGSRTATTDDFAAHPWAGSIDGHNCVDCGEDGFWRCAPDQHIVPRWDSDPVAKEHGWVDGQCGICGSEDHAEAQHGNGGTPP